MALANGNRFLKVAAPALRSAFFNATRAENGAVSRRFLESPRLLTTAITKDTGSPDSGKEMGGGGDNFFRRYTWNYRGLFIPVALFAASSKGLIILNEEILVAGCFVAFITYVKNSFGQTIRDAYEEKRAAITNDLFAPVAQARELNLALQQEQKDLRDGLKTMPQLVDSVMSLPIHECAPNWQKTVLSKALNSELAALRSAASQKKRKDMILDGFHLAVKEKFRPGE